MRLPRLEARPLGRRDLGLVAILVAVCFLAAAVLVDWARAPVEDLAAGDVAPRTVEAPTDFSYQDFAARERRQQEAREAVAPVFVHRASLSDELQVRIERAFAEGRRALDIAEAAGDEDPLAPVSVAFRAALGSHVPNADLRPLVDAGFPATAEVLSQELLGRAMRGYIARDPSAVPDGPIRVIELRALDREEVLLRDRDRITSVEDAYERVSLALVELAPKDNAEWVDSASRIARASLRPNLEYNALETEQRREEAAASVPMETIRVKRGEILFRQGDVLTAGHVLRYRALQSLRGDGTKPLEVGALGLFLVVLFATLYTFAGRSLRSASTRMRDASSVGVLVILTAVMARVSVYAAPALTPLLGIELDPAWFGFAVPVAGMAMLVRLLMGVGWTFIYVVAAASVCGVAMDLQALHVLFFLISGMTAGSAVENARERMSILLAGGFTGLVNAVTVGLIHFVLLYQGVSELSLETATRLPWAMGLGLAGGVVSGFLVLGLVPVFEALGFVTDYRLLELANLNHPLLRQLMVRAPGSYHHSVIVGSLAEAAAQEVGANALMARVASYFHDIGKSVKPQYFIENQRGAPNRHDKLDPEQSAQVIINHVIDGAKMAQEYNLPKPILDNIYMHHGTGVLSFFLRQARENAEDPTKIDESRFRYPGPKPSTREAGIIMLADKVEAATRTIKEPTEENIRNMIHRIVNSVMADGQFSECPLTFKEIHSIADTFVKVLMGIYHQRIEYQETRDVSRNTGNAARGKLREQVPASGVITLEVLPGGGSMQQNTGTDGAIDYESVEHLPGEE
ncbi:MAG: HDIG domain-containing protein [Deltaproteobacteria bacterium]|nr:MAG: HDIG domain-containing protein [Deltaproteobacteria bacterium]